VLKQVIWAAALIIVILVAGILLTYNARQILFIRLPWFIVGAMALGLGLGVFRGIRHNMNMRRPGRQTERHTLDSFFEHWGTAIGLLVLTISGFFIETHYRRGFASNLHFLGLLITVCFGAYFLADFCVAKKYRYLFPGIRDIFDGTIRKYLFRKTWRDAGKYESTQKAAFLAFLVLGIVIAASGGVKTAAYYFSLPGQSLYIATEIHNVCARLFAALIVVHILFAVSVPSHRRLLISLFTGKNQ
jgi:cytochrome b subunit of formate dehydrogenase